MNFYNFLFLFFALVLIRTIAFSQEFQPLKSPDVTAFMSANYLPVSEYTGRAEVEIPIYVINLDGLEIPISISYDGGGVNINSSSSRVGLNWSLNAGGMISKEIMGYQDLEAKVTYNPELAKYIYTEYGYLRSLSSLKSNEVAPIPHRDTQPDLYYVAAPGLVTKFTHKPNAVAFELSNTASKIKSALEPNPSEEASLDYSEWAPNFRFEITTPNGFVYDFGDREYNCVFPLYRDFEHLTDNLVNTPWDENKSQTEVMAALYGVPYGSVLDYWPSSYRELFPVTHITSIKNPVTGRVIQFYYEDNYVVDNNRRIERKFSFNSANNTELYSQVNYEHDYSKEKMIDKIVFPEGIIDFYYEGGRLDIRGGKRLSKIEVRNHSGTFIKGIVFEHDYFVTSGCTDPQCFRLKLNAVKFVDKNNNVLPGYNFEYNNTMLPKRYSLNHDFMGFYNGNHGVNLKNYTPRLYYKANQGRNTYLPFSLPNEGYQLLTGNASLTSNLQYAKAGILKKVTYPTGGYTIFNYGLNSFIFLNTEIQGGGLRILSQSMYNADGTQQKSISYDYQAISGLSSGSLLNLPRYFEGTGITNLYHLNQVGNNKLEITNGAYIGYSQTKITEAGNGYTINNYSSALEYPNIYPATYELHNSTEVRTQDLISKGIIPSVYQNMDVKRSKLLTSKVYDNQNALLKTITNEYTYFVYDQMTISEHVFPDYYVWSQFNDGSNHPYTLFPSQVVSESFQLTRTTTEETSLGAGNLSNETTFTYNSTKPLLIIKNESLNTGENKTENYYYPFDSEVSSMPNISTLNSLNIFNPIKRTYYKNGNLLSTTLTSYGNFGSSKVLPTLDSESFGNNPMEPKSYFNQYDIKGNLIEYTQRNGVPITVLWGYNYQYKIAEIVGSTYTEVLAALGVSNLDYLQFLSNDLLVNELNNLRTALPNAQLFSYIHIPLVGVKSITDPNGNTSNYEYDNFGRLTHIKDHSNNIISRHEYNYKTKPSVSITPINLSLSIKKGRVDSYESISPSGTSPVSTMFTADVKGGLGDYTYEWSQVGSSTILGTTSTFSTSFPCGSSYAVQLKVTDTHGNSVTKTLTSNARQCSEPFYSKIESYTEDLGYSTATRYRISAEGGSYRFKYKWYKSLGSTVLEFSDFSYDNVFPFTLTNNSSNQVTFTLKGIAKDIESDLTVERTIYVNVPPEFEPPSCFAAGTKILMKDGSEKSIEKVMVGDQVLTYNVESKVIEAGEVEEIVTPTHSNMIEIGFENGISNTSTFDHPYYIEGKGWSSYLPSLTKTNYGLEVNQIEIGDVALLFDPCNKVMKHVKLIKFTEKAGIVTTYNLAKVSKNHNFLANGILVHNKSSVVE